MGDMKTPDFDDLLAAFDIPDATGLDAKESIQGNHEVESQLKHTEMCLDDRLLSNQVIQAETPVVSVIVKNTHRQESFEGFNDRLPSVEPPHNGFQPQETSANPSKINGPDFSQSVASTNGESPIEPTGETSIQLKPDGMPIFSQTLSQISSISNSKPEDTLCSRNYTLLKQETPGFPAACVSVEDSVPSNPKQMGPRVFDSCANYTEEGTVENGHGENTSNIGVHQQIDSVISALPHQSKNQSIINTNSDAGNMVNTAASFKPDASQTSKLSSCLEALVALNARKDPSEQSSPKMSSTIQKDCLRAGAKIPISPISPRSPLEAVKRLIKPSDSPVSICSDSSGKASPAVLSGSPPVIPRVRIKTIKTTSGQIKRTVTSVLPDSETDELHSAYESSPSQSMISEDSFCNMSPCQSHASDPNIGISLKNHPANKSSTKVLHKKSEGYSGERRKSPSIFHNPKCRVKRSSHEGQKPKRTSAMRGNKANTSYLPKAMHLATLNLVPHSVAASVAARTTSHQQTQHTISSTVCSTVPLVHQVQSVNSFTHIADTNTATGPLSRLLNKGNPVPVYVPNLNPPPESGIILPTHGYCCLECGDAFGVEKSLAYHYNRRSVHIEVGCSHCGKTLVFFNKCALLAHAREHKHNGIVMQCAQLDVKPITEENMFLPLNSELSKATFYTPAKSEPVLPLRLENIARRKHRCVECNKQLSDSKALAGHYQKSSKDVKGLICKVCLMLLPNKCSFTAHQRLHANKSPFCCPECGTLCRSSDIQKHVRENCLHYARKAWYKCLHCEMVFRTLVGQKTHIEEKHCEVFYKCSICPVAFKTSARCDGHLKNKHDAVKQAPQLVFKCSCEAIFKKKKLLFQHFYQDASKRVTCIFKCPECNCVFSQKLLFMDHFSGVHAGNVAADLDKDTKAKDRTVSSPDAHTEKQQKGHSSRKTTDSPRKKSEQSNKTGIKPIGWTCGECLLWFAERESYISHVKTNHGKSVRKYPCRHCDLSFNSPISLRRHIRSDHDGKRRIYSCWHCTDSKTTFTTSVMLKNHISLMHGIKNPDLSQMPKSSILECKRTPRKGRLLPTPELDTQADGPDLEATSAKRPRTQFRCLKCGFLTDDSAEFQQHIPQHKTNENTPQCLHCGLCFTSPLSLNRHLFIVHKVREEETNVGEKKQKNQTVTSAETGKAKESVTSLVAEPESSNYTKTHDCHVRLTINSDINSLCAGTRNASASL